ncbi:hypothetical protein FHR75_000182 [Kineococcus radiotolerans]|uniref:Uncharacterized protein n=2 Tax=Kineococcus radiotolerans TaxID=131568 RepID=A6W9J8_KINRD|nr:hypothetical protein [Kineococcus radiotolerans]ABS03487.1 hypothetical protein Krad_2002 [Kineococcus radiotolerans SRS30216 = ATCC BAA-149]MBB2899394.1 hypothetical protein [Kineococcus radiotolerans]
MARTRSPSPPVGAVLTLGLAGGAALVFAVTDAVGFRSERAESLSTPLWVLGWALLVWATIAGGVCATHLAHRLLSPRPPARAETLLRLLLLLTSAALITAVVRTHPLWGSGSGTG